jgi:cyclic pyranopterin monophosphate synthase
MGDFSHYDDGARSRMVDVTVKRQTIRTARASAFVKMRKETIQLIRKKLIPKGDPFEVSKIAGIMAAKRTAGLIPMCHPLAITHADIVMKIDGRRGGIAIESSVKLEGKTGVEMEALVAASVAALTLYDMCKAVDRDMVIEEVRLLEKKGGKSDYRHA